MKETLQSLNNLNKKGGSMLRKVLSVLVICSFMFTNVCFAMPSAVAANPAADNIALRSPLDQSLSAEQIRTITSLFDKVAEMQADGTEEKAYLKNFISEWKKGNLTRNADQTAAFGDAVNDARIDYSVDGQLTLTFNGVTAIISSGTEGITFDLKNGAAGKADAENYAELASSLTADSNIIDDSLYTNARKQDAAAKINADLDAALANGYDAAKADAIKAGVDAAVVRLAKNIAYINDDNYSAARSDAEVKTIYDGLSDAAFADVLLHEVLEGLGYNDTAALAEVAAIRGINVADRKNTANQMGQTRDEIQNAVKDAKAKQEKELSDLNLPKSLAEESAKAEDVKNAVVKAAEDNKLDSVVTVVSDKSADIVKQTVAGLINERVKAVIDALPGKVDAFVVKANANKANSTDEVNALTAALASLKDNRQTVLSVADLTVVEDGITVLNASGARFFNDLSQANVNAGLLTFIGAETSKKKSEFIQAITLMYGKEFAAKFSVYEGKEDKVAAETKSPLTVIYSNASLVAGNVEGVEYFEVKNLNSGMANILQAIIDVMALSAQQKASLIEADGTIKMEAVAIDKAAYDDMKKEYKEVVELLIQA